MMCMSGSVFSNNADQVGLMDLPYLFTAISVCLLVIRSNSYLLVMYFV